MDKTSKKKRIFPSKKAALSASGKQARGENGERYLKLLEHLPIGVYRTTPDGKIVEANPALARILGYTEAELKKINVKNLYAKKSERDEFLKMVHDGKFAFYEFRLRRKDGKTIWGRDYSHAVTGPDGVVEHYDGILADITREKMAEEKLKKTLSLLRKSGQERKEMIQKLQSYSMSDDLTGLYNRRGFFTVAKEYLNLAARNKTKMFLLFMDMDHLKHINDSFGHHIGDAALVQMANILKNTFRNSDIKGRMGGDEFAIFPIETGLAGVEIALGRLSKNIDIFNSSKEANFRLSISTGVACYDPEYPSTIEELLIRADKLMYEEKREKHEI
jgi:diguanylate cyclase (GGDEF)-like protein/PAS domain S-box-containing protein